MSEALIAEAPRRTLPKPLYVKLRPRPNGPGSKAVADHQRARLSTAMMEMIVSRGYSDTSIKALCTLAGVSRRTFYELFDSTRRRPKGTCFLDAYKLLDARAAERVNLAYRSEEDPERRLCHTFEQFVWEVATEPEAARQALVKVLGAGRATVVQMQRTRLTFEQLLRVNRSESPYGVALPPLLVRGIVCGVERIAHRWPPASGVQELSALVDELQAWVLCYRSPAATKLLAPSTAQHEGTAPWPSPARVENDRARILCCAARIAGAKGYAQLTPARIVRDARVSEATFETLFESVEQCFLDAFDRLGLEALVCAARASRSTKDRLAGVHRGIAALMRHIATNPVLVRNAFVEILAVGPAGIQRRERLLGQFTDLLIRSLPRSQRPSDLVAEASAGAIWGIIQDHVARGATQLLPRLAGHATYLVLAPAIGAEAAVQVILASESR